MASMYQYKKKFEAHLAKHKHFKTGITCRSMPSVGFELGKIQWEVVFMSSTWILIGNSLRWRDQNKASTDGPIESHLEMKHSCFGEWNRVFPKVEEEEVILGWKTTQNKKFVVKQIPQGFWRGPSSWRAQLLEMSQKTKCSTRCQTATVSSDPCEMSDGAVQITLVG